MLEYASIPYEFELLKGEAFRNAQASNSLPYDQLPVLDVNGVRMAQSGAICRYVAKLADLYPLNPLEACQTDEIFEMGQELSGINPIVNTFRGEVWERHRQEYFSTFARKVENVSRRLAAGIFFDGKRPLYGDFHMLHVLSNVLLVSPQALKEHANIREWIARMQALPGLKEYLDSRPEVVDIGLDPKLVEKVKVKCRG
eukprot:gnl/TRDRNA2_/TRDRNA2_189272_c0_seq1.p1 gnl/TRDRNA2_/TRDRNA2_189272_c0~~gnl/TRDRNA2_/TRDRNA2_189272_c0_seq1.p1  ORF type:complete len:199 (+),score=33.51 gnl/TRDRNA2_/TRDRNA2_189272_c0_seq1:229-825(+)